MTGAVTGVRLRASTSLCAAWLLLTAACCASVGPPAAAPPRAIQTEAASVTTTSQAAPRPEAVDAARACVHDAAAEAALATELTRRIASAGLDSGAHAQVSFHCVDAAGVAPRTGRIEGLRGSGHGGYLFLVEATFDASGAADVRAIRFKPRVDPQLGWSVPSIEVARARLSEVQATGLWSHARAALMADVRVDYPTAQVGERQTVAVHATTHDEQVLVRMRSGADAATTGEWHGYVNSLGEARRAPVDLAWHALFDAAPMTFATAVVDDDDRRLLLHQWPLDAGSPGWMVESQLDLASLLPGAELAASIAGHLDDTTARRQILAVNALAAITGQDLRRDANHQLRPLATIVELYKQALTRHP